MKSWSRYNAEDHAQSLTVKEFLSHRCSQGCRCGSSRCQCASCRGGASGPMTMPNITINVQSGNKTSGDYASFDAPYDSQTTYLNAPRHRVHFDRQGVPVVTPPQKNTSTPPVAPPVSPAAASFGVAPAPTRRFYYKEFI